MNRRDLAGRPRAIGPHTPRDRVILLCDSASDDPCWEIGHFDRVTGRWFAGDFEDFEMTGGHPDFYFDPTHWAPLPALPPRDRTRLH